MFPAIVSRVMCYKKLSIELFIYCRASLRQDAATGHPGAFHYHPPLPWVIADFTLKNRQASLWSAQRSTEDSIDLKSTRDEESSQTGMVLLLTELKTDLWGVPSSSNS